MKISIRTASPSAVGVLNPLLLDSMAVSVYNKHVDPKPHHHSEVSHHVATDQSSLSPQQPQRVLPGILLAGGSTLLWGSTAVIVRGLAIEGVSMPAVAFLRVLVGGCVLGLLLTVRRHASVPRAVRSLRNPWMLLGTISYGLNMLVFHVALRHTSASTVMLLENTAPLVTLLGGILLFSERTTIRRLAALLPAALGVWLVTTASQQASTAPAPAGQLRLLGITLSILAAITWGSYTLACRGLGRGRSRTFNDGVEAMCVMLFGSALILAPLLVAPQSWPSTPATWMLIILLGTTHTALAALLWRLAMNYITSYTASLLFLLTIVFTMINATFFLKESVTVAMLLGALCIMSSLLLNREPSPKRTPPPKLSAQPGN